MPPRLPPRVLAALAVIAAAVLLVAAYYLVFPMGGGDVKLDMINSLVEGVEAGLEVYSRSFPRGGVIPERFTCDGDDVSPSIVVEGIPGGTRSLLVIMYDPDAPGGTFIHWILVWELPEGAEEAVLLEGASPGGGLIEGFNDFGVRGYRGPCPPRGDEPHRYVILVAALDSVPELDEDPTLEEVVEEARGRVLAYGTITGYYSRG